MGELTIRRNRGFPVTRQPETGKAEKSASSGKSQSVSKTAAPAVQETLQQRSGATQAATLYRESRRTLQTGEIVLSNVQDSLSRMAELALEAAGGENADRAALQAELERLSAEIDRMVGSAVSGDAQLFFDGDEDMGGEVEALLYAVIGEASSGDSAQGLPDWLIKGIAQDSLTTEDILHSLGLDETASASDVLKALSSHSLENSPAASRLAALYLGAVIAGAHSGSADPSAALEGLRQLLEKIQDGVPADEAIELLTNGEFTSFSDFQSRFTGGTAPGLEKFLFNLLLTDIGFPSLVDTSLLSVLAGMQENNLDLLMGLLTASQTSVPTPEAAQEQVLPEAAETAPQTAAAPDAAAEPTESVEMGNVQVLGRDLSGVSFDQATGVLTVGGTADVTIRGTEQGEQAIIVTGSGTITLEGVKASSLTIAAPQAQVLSTGENALSQVHLRPGVTLTLDGSGVVRLGVLRASETNTLRLTGGAVVMAGREGQKPAALTIPVVLDGPVSLAAQASNVRTPDGKAMEPLDILWKALIPGWNSITAMTLDGKQAKMSLLGEELASSVRLWLAKENSSQGHPIHPLVIQGRDKFGHLRTRYTYLRWSQRAGAFQEISMYPNPFTITGGEDGQDWVYDDTSRTLHILSSQVTAVSGGAGVDAQQSPFSGKIALADSIGTLELSLSGVVCRVSSGRAFNLGRENQVTLLLESGTSNHFESGRGCAGISLGDGTSLNIGCTASTGGRNPPGELTATGGSGGAGIGRDSGESRDRTSQIVIRGGIITATGTGGGAGIGAGKRGYMGAITITGGDITATGGSGGGAGIGGALGAPVGDISITGGKISASAAYQAAAIGAGIRGRSGNIQITGTARITKAQGGNPGADIGACLFGECGKVEISRGIDIGGSQLWDHPGVALQAGDETVTLPQFRLSSRALQLSGLSLATRESAQAANAILAADRRWVSLVQGAYSTLYGQVDQGFHGPRLPGSMEELVRDSDSASTLLRALRQSSSLSPHAQRDTDELRQLLR